MFAQQPHEHRPGAPRLVGRRQSQRKSVAKFAAGPAAVLDGLGGTLGGNGNLIPPNYWEENVIKIYPVTLEGHGVRLEPLGYEHQAGLAAAAADGKLWELWFTFVPEPGQTHA